MDFNKLINSAKNVVGNATEYVNKNNQESSLKLTYKNLLNQIESNTVRKDVNGNYYISALYSESSPRYAFERFEFDGGSTIQNTKTTGSQSSNAGKVLGGSMIAGPLGALMGAAGKKKINTTSTTTTKEVSGSGKLFLRSLDTNQIKQIKFNATPSEFSNIERFFG
ncbi:hypothetical protein [Globicatella sanguinis]